MLIGLQHSLIILGEMPSGPDALFTSSSLIWSSTSVIEMSIVVRSNKSSLIAGSYGKST